MVAEKYTDYAIFCAHQLRDWVDPEIPLTKAEMLAKRHVKRSIAKVNCYKAKVSWAASQAVYAARQCEQSLLAGEEHMTVVFATRAAEYSTQALVFAARMLGKDEDAVRERAVAEQRTWLKFAHI